MITLKVALFVLAQQLGAKLWPHVMAYLHRATWPQRIAIPWMAAMVVGPVLLFKHMYPKMPWGEVAHITALIFGMLVLFYGAIIFGPVVALWCVAKVVEPAIRRWGSRHALPPDGSEKKPGPFLRRL